mgnify:CR=1 FL=1
MNLTEDAIARFSALMDEYRAPIRRLCGAYARHGADRDDLFQDVSLGVWRSLPSFRGECSTRTWMYRVAHNVALTWQVRQRRRGRREEPIEAGFDPPGSGDTDFRRLALERALAGLTPADRLLTVLWLEGLTAAEIHDVTGVEPGTVAVRLSRIRQRLTPRKDEP